MRRRWDLLVDAVVLIMLAVCLVLYVRILQIAL